MKRERMESSLPENIPETVLSYPEMKKNNFNFFL